MNLKKEFEKINEYYSPIVIAEVNDTYIKLAKFKGELFYHIHEKEDEMFVVIKGEFKLWYMDTFIILKENDLFVVQKGVSHKPEAEEEAWVMMIEKKSTQHTGNIKTSKFTKTLEDQLKNYNDIR